MLHFHRLENDERLALFDDLVFGNSNANDDALHGGGDFVHWEKG